MRKRVLCFCLCLLMLPGCGSVPAPPEDRISVVDDTGATVSVPRCPERVAVLTSSLADLWVSAGGAVDITVYETVERGFAGADAVLVDDGAGKTVELERLVAEKPDLVIYSPELAGQVQCAQLLREASIPALGFEVEDLQGYLWALEICADILGTQEEVEPEMQALKLRVRELLDGNDLWTGAEPVSVLFVRAGSDARFTKAKTADQHFACAMLQHLGTHNIAEDAPVLLDGLSIEHILMADPQVILFTTMGDESAGRAYMQSLIEDPVWQELSAVRNGAVHQLPKELFHYKPNSRWDEAYAYLIRCIYGGAS